MIQNKRANACCFTLVAGLKPAQTEPNGYKILSLNFDIRWFLFFFFFF